MLEYMQDLTVGTSIIFISHLHNRKFLLGGMHDGSSLLSLSPRFGHGPPNRRRIPNDASLSYHLQKLMNPCQRRIVD